MSSFPIEEQPMRLAPIRVGWMTLEQAAEYAGEASVSTIRRAAKEGELRVSRRGNLIRTKPEWVDAWLDPPGEDYEDDE